jgi:hypothetical protein
VSCCSSY